MAPQVLQQLRIADAVVAVAHDVCDEGWCAWRFCGPGPATTHGRPHVLIPDELHASINSRTAPFPASRRSILTWLKIMGSGRCSRGDRQFLGRCPRVCAPKPTTEASGAGLRWESGTMTVVSRTTPVGLRGQNIWVYCGSLALL